MLWLAEFIERMDLTYGDKAAAAGVYVASACAFDSMPADFGTLLAQRAFAPPSVSLLLPYHMLICLACRQ